jgi:2-C-methyl-D-erythritol 2,4-cyclodiphosphate synthase
MSELRVGIGYDVHRLIEGRPLVLGGVEVEHESGLDGHSDADVLAHALMAQGDRTGAANLLGAMRAGDVGEHFPDDDDRWKGASSIGLLRRVSRMLEDAGYRLVDADCVISAERPRLSGYRDEMRHNLVDPSRVGLKATTTEGLGPEGREEGVAARAVVLAERIRVGPTAEADE